MACVRLHHARWVADYVDEFGQRHRERPEGSFENKAQERRAAQALLSRRLEEIQRHAYTPPSERLIFGEVARRYLESKVGIRSTTRRSYASLIELYLTPYFGERKIHQISAADIERYRTHLAIERPPPIASAFAARLMAERPGLSRARAKQRVAMSKPGVRTINKSLTLLVMIFNYAARHRWVDYNPAEHVEKLRAPVSPDGEALDSNILTPAEVRTLIEAAEPARRAANGELAATGYRLIIQTAVFTGMRSGELRGLQWGDIDWLSRQIHVRRAWKEGEFTQPKTQASVRRIDLPEFLVNELREWRLACPKGKHDLVFPNLVGNPISAANLLQRGFYPALRRAGLRRIRFHDLRHTFASLLIANGEDIVRVSRLLGHASPAITLKVYSHMLPREHYRSTEVLSTLVFGDAANPRRGQLPT
jgi:integrase